jgi:lipoprotein NlpD
LSDRGEIGGKEPPDGQEALASEQMAGKGAGHVGAVKAGAADPAAGSVDPNGAWRWPAKGPASPSHLGQQGVEIAGAMGDPVRAAADGVVVYSDSGLPGYGKLILIQHGKELLSAYGNNDKLLVQKGARVKAGQEIAEMGQSGGKRPLLHFEIRRRGKPVPATDFLPRQ